MVERHWARQAALEILYQREITGSTLEKLADDRFGSKTDTESLVRFSRKLLDGVSINQAKIDELIDSYAENWVLERLPLIDRNILRIAIYEMIYEEDIPISVSINEAVELGKKYGSAESGKFINGVLGQLAVDLERQREESAELGELKEAE